MSIETAVGKSATIEFNGQLCIHARRCVLSQPTVFKANVEGPWIDPDAASAEALMYVALNCPSGAIRVSRATAAPMKRTRRSTPSRCAKTVRWPSTRRSCWRARRSEPGRPSAAAANPRTSPIATTPTSPRPSPPPASRPQPTSAALAKRDGPLEITPYPNGPLGVAGPVEIISGTGRTVNRVERTALCRCGHSANKPYCDGAHAKVGFVAP